MDFSIQVSNFILQPAKKYILNEMDWKASASVTDQNIP